MEKLTAIDLTEATSLAVNLADAVGQAPVVAGALALAAHGYHRQTVNVDIVIPVIMGSPEGNAIESAARSLGFVGCAQQPFGRQDFRIGESRVNVLMLDSEAPALTRDAVREAVAAGRTLDLFGQKVFVVSVSHLIAMKMAAERRKDTGDIVELIKARIEAGQWDDDQAQVRAVVREHLGWYAVRVVDKLSKTARDELGIS